MIELSTEEEEEEAAEGSNYQDSIRSFVNWAILRIEQLLRPGLKRYSGCVIFVSMFLLLSFVVVMYTGDPVLV
jgi:hypothetical protein